MPLASGQSLVELLLWGVILTVLVGALAWLVLSARRRIKAPPEDEDPFSIMQLERLRESGQLTDEEFRQLRLTALGLSTDRTPARDRSDATGEGQRDDQGRPGRARPPETETE